MKRSKVSKVSWSPGPKLCQIKMYRPEDCPAKLASQPQRLNYPNQLTAKPRGPDLPPGFEGSHYADKLNVLNISRIKWKQPPKFIVDSHVGVGGESTESRTESLRISKVLEAIYPHRSSIPPRPSVSPVIEAKSFDDSKTPIIRLTPIEDEWEPTEESSNSALKSGLTAINQSQMETTKPSCSTQELVSGLAPDLRLATSAALTSLMKTKEQGNMVDPDLLIKFLSDPKMLKNLINGKTGKSSATENQSVEPLPQHVTTSHVARNPQPLIIPREPSFATSKPFTNPEQRQVSPPKPENVNRLPVLPIVSIAQQPSLPARLLSSSMPMNPNYPRPQHTFSEPKVISKPQPQPQPNSAFHISEMNNVQASTRFGRGPQTGFDSYPMKLNRIEPIARPKPVKSLDYFKNLIKEHGTDSNETNQTGKFNGYVKNVKKGQKKCIYFGTKRGCKLGDSCLYVHDRFKPSFEAEAPMAKRMKFGRYDKNGL